MNTVSCRLQIVKRLDVSHIKISEALVRGTIEIEEAALEDICPFIRLLQ